MPGDPTEFNSPESDSGNYRVAGEESRAKIAAAQSLNQNPKLESDADSNSSQTLPSLPGKEPEYAIYLWIEGLSGESDALHHKEWIVVLAYRQCLRRPTTSSEVLQPSLEVEKKLDRASPTLYHAVHSGRVFDKVVIEVCRDTTKSERFLKIELSKAVITEIHHTGAAFSGSARPTDVIAFRYQQIQWTYTKLRQTDAQREGHSSSSWTHTFLAPNSKKANALN